jgi:hypothetical protein
MSVTRARLTAIGIELMDLTTEVEAYESAVRGQVQAITTSIETVGQSWAGPIPESIMERSQRWLGEVYESGNTVAQLHPILQSWAQSAWCLSDSLPPDGEYHDPDAASLRTEVAALWCVVCRSYADDLASVLCQVERHGNADIGGPLDGMFDMFEVVGDFFAGGFSLLDDQWAALLASGVPIEWTQWMRGQQPRQEDMDLALLSDDVYDVEGWSDPSKVIGNGWTRVPASELPDGLTMADFEDPDDSDMRAALYTDGNGHYVLAFAGTDSFDDLRADVGQGLGNGTDQYHQGRVLGEKLSDAYGDNLVMTGHSLGGGLASYAALATDSTAVTFNAAGLSDQNMENVGLDWQRGREQVARSGQVRAYHVDSDALTNFQEDDDDIPAAVGTPITIANPIEQPSDWWWLVPPAAAGAQGAHAVDMHLMDNVLAGMRTSDISFSTDYTVHTDRGDEARQSRQTYEGGWFEN